MTQTDTKAQPTPGPTLEPWNLAEAEDTFRVIRSEGRLIAKVFTMFPDGAPNARLIAVAPRMLEFITSIVHGNAAERIEEASPSLARLARALLREIHGGP